MNINLVSVPVSLLPPEKKMKRLITSTAPVSEYAGSVNIMIGATNTTPGTLTSATLVQGSTISSFTPNIYNADLLTAPRVTAYRSDLWTETTATPSWGGDAAKQWTNNVYFFSMSFTTSASIIGVIGGSNWYIGTDVLVDEDGNGFKSIAPQQPRVGRNILNSYFSATTYFDFGTALPRKFLITFSSNLFQGIVTNSATPPTPLNLSGTYMSWGELADSIYTAGESTIFRLNAIGRAESNIGGTAYARGGNIPTTAEQAAMTKSALIAQCASQPSIFGNIGYGGITTSDGYTPIEGNPTYSRAIAVSAYSTEIVICAAGINEDGSVIEGVDNTNAGWSLFKASWGSWNQLRTALPRSVIVVVGPWSGSSRGASGISNTSFVAENSNFRMLLDGSLSGYPAIIGPWIFINTADSSWKLRRQDGTYATGYAGSGPWATGQGMTSKPPVADGGNANNLMANDPHPTDYAVTKVLIAKTINTTPSDLQVQNGSYFYHSNGSFSYQVAAGAIRKFPGTTVSYTSKKIATATITPVTLPQTTLTLASGTTNASSDSDAFSTSGYVSVLMADGTYQSVSYTGKTSTTLTGCSGGTGLTSSVFYQHFLNGCTVASGSISAAAGDNVYSLNQLGSDYYGQKIADAMLSAINAI